MDASFGGNHQGDPQQDATRQEKCTVKTRRKTYQEIQQNR
jgi:hypothetical protein